MSKKKKMPSIFTMAKNFAKDLGKYIKEGAPNVTNKQYTERLEACNKCPHLNKKQMRCTLCGCLIEHKAKWKTTTCPDTPPRWKALYKRPGTPATERERHAKNINKILKMGAEDKMWDPQNPETLDPFLKGIGIKGGTIVIDEKGNTENREEKEENKDKD
tara:strand:- start:725 stop:1204 length:480 start_codon:yes stop_codon:yes gene_type:complete